MLIAILNGERVTPRPRQRGAVCDLCGRPVVARCGPLKIWHYAHVSGRACDHWAEVETRWHLSWKQAFPPDCCEVRLGNHRADVWTPEGRIIEFQHSPIGLPDVLERTQFYAPRGDFHWVLDLTHTAWTIPPFEGVRQCDYTWHRPRRAFQDCATRVWLHLPGEVLLRLDCIRREPGVLAWHGQGCALHTADWLAAVRQGQPLPPPWMPERFELTQQKGRR